MGKMGSAIPNTALLATLYLQVACRSQFCFTMVMHISKLPLFFVIAPWKFYTDRQTTGAFLICYGMRIDPTSVINSKYKYKNLLNNTLTFGDVLLGNVTFFDFCCFWYVTHYVAVNICINCSLFFSVTDKVKYLYKSSTTKLQNAVNYFDKLVRKQNKTSTIGN